VTNPKKGKIMDSRDITQELEHPGARNLLDTATLLRLAYNGSDGFPRVIPIGFYWNGSGIVVCTAATAPKVEALSSRPNVAITIDVGDTPAEAKALLVRGRARVDIVDGVADEYLAASRKGLGADQFPEFERQVRALYDQMARISIEPVWARFFDFGAGRFPAFLAELAGNA
jgi:pyridoxamine 5'-phosphate oxidase-like protein